MPPFAIFGLVAATLTAAGIALARSLSFSWVLSYLGGVNLATLLLYGWDKWAAIKGRLRVPELLLHLMSIVGGTPAAFAAQSAFRHKTVKRSFQVAFWIIAVAQIVLIGTALEWRANPPAWLPAAARSLLNGR